jgi:hypothetical protein
MSDPRVLAAGAVLVLSGLASASAQAAPAPARAAPRQAVSRAETAKHAACEKVWAAQKVRHGSREAFVAACVAKG